MPKILLVVFILLLSACASTDLESSSKQTAEVKTLSLEQIRANAQAETQAMIAFLSKCIQYQSVEEFGYQLQPETQQLRDFVLTTAKSMGYTTKTAANGLVGVVEYGEGQESVGVLIHLDVVPVSKQETPEWTHPPFSGDVTSEEVWGRGAQDDKGALASVLWAGKFLIDNQATFKRKLIFILGTKEEKSFEDLTTYFKEFPQQQYGPTLGFVPDGAYISQGEKGIADMDYTFTGLTPSKTARDSFVAWNGGTEVNTVADFSYLVINSKNPKQTQAELKQLITDVTNELKTGKSDTIYGVKAAYQANLAVSTYRDFIKQFKLKSVPKGDLVLYSKGTAAHGSAPWEGKNAIVEVALVGARMTHSASNAYKNAFQFITRKIGLSTDGSGLGIEYKTKPDLPVVPPGMDAGQYLGTSANLGLVSVKPEQNQLILSIDFRTGFANTNDELFNASAQSLAQFSGTAAYQPGIGSHYEPLYFPSDSPLLSLMVNSYRAVNTDHPKEFPYVFMTPATTYLKLVKNFVNFGPVDLYPDFYANYFHQKNERTTIKSLVNNSVLFAYTLQHMLQMEQVPLR